MPYRPPKVSRPEGKAKRQKASASPNVVQTSSPVDSHDSELPLAATTQVRAMQGSGRGGPHSRKRKRTKTSESAEELPTPRRVRFLDIAAKQESEDEELVSDHGRGRGRHRELKSSPIPIDFSSERGPISTPVGSDDEGKIGIFRDESPQHNGTKNGADSKEQLKTILREIGKLDNGEVSGVESLMEEIRATRRDIAGLEQRRQVDEARAVIRHEVVFNVLKKVSQEMHSLASLHLKSTSLGENGLKEKEPKTKRGSTPTPHSKPLRHRDVTPRAEKTETKTETKQRVTMERLVGNYTRQLNEAKTVEDVEEAGELCVKYAENLVRSYN
ncbi:hypothetical protein B0T16DRAFT_389099 [Cercophora newfieldiana]|uniref:Uncharacterized protein n=1 Tax=Cercophora newfieldiana TaxID=92897 RepID=A0AA39YDD6_9PEZI|nr:hypothetical protein B0T16DRAFT_389099 [Cercophora newfieldiana]